MGTLVPSPKSSITEKEICYSVLPRTTFPTSGSQSMVNASEHLRDTMVLYGVLMLTVSFLVFNANFYTCHDVLARDVRTKI